MRGGTVERHPTVTIITICRTIHPHRAIFRSRIQYNTFPLSPTAPVSHNSSNLTKLNSKSGYFRPS